MRKSVIAAAVLALSSTAAFAAQNPNVSSSSPYAIGAYDVNAKAGIGSGFETAVAPGKVVGVLLTPLTVVPVVINNIAH